jgi:hypothetical protein
MAKVHREIRARQERLKQAENRVASIFQSKVSMWSSEGVPDHVASTAALF